MRTAIRKTAPRSLPRELTDDEFAALDFERVRCTTCTPCCMAHVHFLYQGKVIWACQRKLEARREGAERARGETGPADDERRIPR